MHEKLQSWVDMDNITIFLYDLPALTTLLALALLDAGRACDAADVLMCSQCQPAPIPAVCRAVWSALLASEAEADEQKAQEMECCLHEPLRLHLAAGKGVFEVHITPLCLFVRYVQRGEVQRAVQVLARCLALGDGHPNVGSSHQEYNGAKNLDGDVMALLWRGLLVCLGQHPM